MKGRKEERKTEFIYAFEMFVSWDKECFTSKLSLIGCCYITKTGFKKMYNCQSLNSNWT